jgi:hypothetical protein
MIKSIMFIMGGGLVVILRRGEWNELSGHSNDCRKNRLNLRTNSLQQGENDVGGNRRKLTPKSFNNEDENSRANSLQQGENDVDRTRSNYVMFPHFN